MRGNSQCHHSPILSVLSRLFFLLHWGYVLFLPPVLAISHAGKYIRPRITYELVCSSSTSPLRLSISGRPHLTASRNCPGYVQPVQVSEGRDIRTTRNVKPLGSRFPGLHLAVLAQASLTSLVICFGRKVVLYFACGVVPSFQYRKKALCV